MDLEAKLEEKPGRLDMAYLDQLNALQKSGALDDLASLRKENRELDGLINDAASLFALKEIEEMLAFVISRFLERFIPVRLAFLVEPPRGDRLDQYCYANLKPTDEHLPERYYAPLRDFFLASPFPIDFVDIERRLGTDAFGEQFRAFEPEILFPLTGLGGLYGIVIFGKKIVGTAYSELERMYADRIIRFLSIGMQNSLHHESSITDSKTGLYNHQHFMRRLEQEIARTRRHRESAGIVMLDVDHFKHFNDTWGHLAGDEVLIQMARTVKQAIRLEDVAARFGGEEFCVLVVECDEGMLLDVAERIRLAIESMIVIFEGQQLRVTASIGCCYIAAARQDSPETLIGRADKALYLSKSGGRNRSTVYKSGLLDRAAALRVKTG